MRISRILHAGYIFESAGVTIAFDPIFENPFSKNCFAFPEVDFDRLAISQQNFDAVFISHYHDDHFSLESLDLLHKDTPIYMFSIFEELFDLLTELSFKKVHAIQLYQPITLGPIRITALEALDQDVDSLYHIQAEGLNLLHVVDSWVGPITFNKLLETPRWDMVLWPFQTLREIEVMAPSSAEAVTAETRRLPPEWIAQLKELNPRAIIPSSCQFQFEKWSWYNDVFFPISYAQFEGQISEVLAGTQVCRLDPGESLNLHSDGVHPGKPLSWVWRLGESSVDYHFKPEKTPPPIADIAQMLEPLRQEQQKLVSEFCQEGLLTRFRTLNPIEDFAAYWHLRVYDHEGKVKKYQYRISANQIEKIPASEKWDWCTEISENKLYGALEEGESLTSIYLRVNTEKGDPMEDPLLRCLYEGIIGAYQKAQLKKILKEKTR